MEAIKDAEKIINPLLNKDHLDEADKEDALNVKAQLDHSKVYYEWLAQLCEALETGEIFKYFPIPEHKMKKIKLQNIKSQEIVTSKRHLSWLFFSYRLSSSGFSFT